MKKIQTLGLNLSRCFGDNIPKCVKDDVLFSHNFDWNLLNEEFSENNVEAPSIKCVIVTTKLVLAPNIVLGHAFKSLVSSPIFSNKHCYYDGDFICHSESFNHISCQWIINVHHSSHS